MLHFKILEGLLCHFVPQPPVAQKTEQNLFSRAYFDSQKIQKELKFLYYCHIHVWVRARDHQNLGNSIEQLKLVVAKMIIIA